MEGYIQDILGNLIMFFGMWTAAFRMPKRSLFWVRLAGCFAVFCGIRYLVFQQGIPLIHGDYVDYVRMAAFSLIIAMLVFCAWFCWEMDFWPALFCATTSYCVQHLINRFYNIVNLLWPEGRGPVRDTVVFVALTAVFLLVFFLMISRMNLERLTVDNKPQMLLSVVVVLTAIVMDLYFFRAIREGGTFLRVLIYTYSILTAGLVLWLQYRLVTGKRERMELETIRGILDEEKDQYLFEKSIIDTVNIKCHDLKHQIAALDENARRQLDAEATQIIEDYDMRFHTGSPALDVVLTRKNFTCREKNVTMTCMAQGEALSFMSDVDIYSLFGNHLDNAIEAAEKMPEEERIVKLTVEKQGFFVRIHAENYFSEKLQFVDGVPQTTKGDAINHGYGIKSMDMLVKKYDGSLRMNTQGDRFALDILFPV